LVLRPQPLDWFSLVQALLWVKSKFLAILVWKELLLLHLLALSVMVYTILGQPNCHLQRCTVSVLLSLLANGVKPKSAIHLVRLTPLVCPKFVCVHLVTPESIVTNYTVHLVYMVTVISATYTFVTVIPIGVGLAVTFQTVVWNVSVVNVLTTVHFWRNLIVAVDLVSRALVAK
jgi:hypothetical protein